METIVDFERLKFTDDYVFCHVLMENPDLCREIAERAIGRKIKRIVSIQEQKSIRESVDGKGVRFDVVFEDDENTVYDIEMQQTNQKNLPKRTRYYQSLNDLEALRKGKGHNSIRGTYIIFICTFDPFGKGLHKYVAKTMIDGHADIRFDDGVEKIFLNADYHEEPNRVPVDVKEFLDYVKTGLISPGIAEELDNARKRILSSVERRDEYMDLYEKFQWYRTEGREKGREEGRAEVVDTIVKNSGKDLSFALSLAGMTKQEYDTAKEIAEGNE